MADDASFPPRLPDPGRLARSRTRLAAMAALIWTLVLAGSLGWNLYDEHQVALDRAGEAARAAFAKDITFRRWATSHGGVYVPVTPTQPPVPWLGHVPGNTVETTDGRQLALLNPASMLRQMMERYSADYGVQGRITGLKYLNPANAPDPWEARQLQGFERGEREEVWDRTEIDGAPHLRYLHVMYMEQGCQKCHSILGYRNGEVRGAVGVNLPLAPYYEMAAHRAAGFGLSHGVIWLLGLGGIAWSGRQWRRRMEGQHRAETERNESLRRLQTLMGNLPGMVYRCRNDPDWTTEFVSDGCAALTGHPPSDLMDNRVTPFARLIHPDDREPVWSQVQAGLAAGGGFELDYRIVTAAGEEKWVWERGAGVYAEDGTLLALEGLVLDNDARKRAEMAARQAHAETRRFLAKADASRRVLLSVIEDARTAQEALAESELFLRVAVAGANVGLFDWDIAAGRVTYSREWKGQLGYQDDEIRDDFSEWADRLHPEDRERALATLRGVLAEPGAAFEMEFRLRHKDGSYRWIAARATFVLDDAGKAIRMVGGHLDITELKRAEAEVRQINEELEQRVSARTAELETANRELESFSYSVSHDLRAPLRAVTGFAQILARRHRDRLDEEGRHYLDNVVQAGSHMGTLIEDLLRYSRIGRGAVRAQPTALEPIMEGLTATFGERIRETGARLRVLAPLARPLGDPTLIGQIVNNLVENALTYRRPGGAPEIVVASERRGGRVVLSVADNGIGIAPEYHEKVFQVFQRLHGQDEYPGSGVGLAIVAKAAHLMDGQVAVESAPGEGCRFCVTLPAAGDEDLDRQAPHRPAGETSEEGNPP